MAENMDLQTFYTHALQWKYQQEEAERLTTQERVNKINSSWATIAKLIRLALHIDGMTIHETQCDQFTKMPDYHKYFEVDCVFTDNLKDKVEHGDGCLIEGVVRVRIAYNHEEGLWKLINFSACQGNTFTDFDNPYLAFLTVYSSLGNMSIETLDV